MLRRIYILLTALALSSCGAGNSVSTDASVDTQWPLDAQTELGTNAQGLVSPDSFEAFADGQTADIVLGPQGAWMLVVAMRTNGVPVGVPRADVRASLTAEDGTLFGKFHYKRRPVSHMDDGWGYVMNLYLVVSSNVDIWNDMKATLTLSVGESDGTWYEEATPLLLEQRIMEVTTP